MSKSSKVYSRPQDGDEHAVLGQFYCAYDDNFIPSNMFCKPPEPIRSDANAHQLLAVTSEDT